MGGGKDNRAGTAEIFQGFSSPNYTQVPDQLFDHLLPDLSEAELKVLLYIVRRTFGFKKDSDKISLRQLSSGIVSRDGRVLDHGTGLSKSGVTKALLSLRKRGILIRTKNSDSIRGDTPTTYRLRMVGEPLDAGDQVPDLPLSTTEDTPVHGGRHPQSTEGDTPVYAQRQALSTTVDTQKTVKQERGLQERPVEGSKNSNGHNQDLDFDEVGTRLVLVDYLSDIAREFNDQAPLRSSITRAVNLCRASGLELDDFIDQMMVARARTKEYSGSIKAKTAGERGDWKPKPKMGYWFAILEDLVGATPNQAEG